MSSNQANIGLSRQSQDFNPNEQKRSMPTFFNSKKGPAPETTPAEDAPLMRNTSATAAPQQPPQVDQSKSSLVTKLDRRRDVKESEPIAVAKHDADDEEDGSLTREK
jgi:hypothetical protein